METFCGLGCERPVDSDDGAPSKCSEGETTPGLSISLAFLKVCCDDVEGVESSESPVSGDVRASPVVAAGLAEVACARATSIP